MAEPEVATTLDEPMRELSAITPELRDLEVHRSAEIRAAASVILERMQFMNRAGITFKGKRDLYEVLGYSRLITFRDYRDRYARGGVAARIVDALPNATWRGQLELIEDEDPKVSTPFKEEWTKLEQRLQVTSKFQRVDKLGRLSTYAVLLIGAAGEWNTELPKGRGSSDAILYLSAFSGGGGPGGSANSRAMALDADCTIETFDTDTKSPRFGLPATYQLRRTDVSSPELQRGVHWSRIIHVAENPLYDEVYSLPAMQRVWNLLDDLDKVTGGGAEAFWLRANAGLQLDVDKDMALPAAKNSAAALVDQADDYAHQMTRMLRTRGVNIKQLGSATADFSGPSNAILTQIAGATTIPKRILTGSEMGELASSQDRDNWKDQVDGRQQGFAGPYLVRQLINRLIAYNYFPTPVKGPLAYEVKWPHIQTLTEQERAEGAAKWAQVNSTAGYTVFTDAEIREHWYGMEPTEEQDDEAYKAALALKMAMTNKTMGYTVFTSAEIRKTCYGWEDLTPEQKVPIGAPEKISVTKPPDEGGDDAAAADNAASVVKPKGAVPAAPVAPRAASDGTPLSSTQVELPYAIASKMMDFPIAAADLAEDGRETDPHVTVKYGLHTQSPNDVRTLVDTFGPVTLTFGLTSFFSTPKYDVVFVMVTSDELMELNELLSNELPVTDTHPAYRPHATIAYVKPGLGPKYENDARFVGTRCNVDALTFSSADRQVTTIPLGRPALMAAEDIKQTLVALEAAIAANDVATIARIVGVEAVQ